MFSKRWLFALALAGIVSFCFGYAHGAQPRMIGPDGGDVRSLAYDPQNPDRILLGTSSGQIFESRDRGTSWMRFAHLGAGPDYVLDHIIFDPKQVGVIYVGAWTLESEGGSVFKSTDNGHSWQALTSLEGKSVRSMAIAAADPNTLVAGRLNSSPNSGFFIDLYSSPASDPTGYGEGKVWLGAVNVTTDSSGNASFAITNINGNYAGQFISATATAASGDTSEFGLSVLAGNKPRGPTGLRVVSQSPN